jgi:hypothetical protein
VSAAIYPDPNGFVMPPEIKAAVDYLYAAYKGWDVISGFDSICGNIEIDGVAFLRIGPKFFRISRDAAGCLVSEKIDDLEAAKGHVVYPRLMPTLITRASVRKALSDHRPRKTADITDGLQIRIRPTSGWCRSAALLPAPLRPGRRHRGRGSAAKARQWAGRVREMLRNGMHPDAQVAASADRRLLGSATAVS